MTAENQTLQNTLSTEMSGSIAPGWWGMLMLILTEVALFGTLIASYFYLRASSPAWPPSGINPPGLAGPIIMTVILLASGIPMIWATRSIRRGRQSAMKLGMALTFVLGAAFLILQIIALTHETFAPTANAYSSAFYSIAGVYGLDLIGGLLMIAFTLTRALLGHFNERRNLAVSNTGFYWYFLVIVWIFIFLSLYLSPYVL